MSSSVQRSNINNVPPGLLGSASIKAGDEGNVVL